MLDRNELYNRLTETFINYQYRLENPLFKEGDEEEMIRMYRVNSMFHNRVENLVSGVMAVVTSVEDNTNYPDTKLCFRD